MLLRDLLTGETENWTFVVWGSWNKPTCVLGCFRHVSLIEGAYWSLWAQISRQPKLFFWCSLLPVLSYLTAMCEAILSVKEWNRKMKIKQRKRTVIIKVCVVHISMTRKQRQFILNWGPCPPLVTPLSNTVYTFFIFKVWGGVMIIMIEVFVSCTFWHGKIIT